MSRIKILMLGLLAVFAAGAVASASASADEFIVPCHKVLTMGTGEWHNSTCTTTSGTKEYTTKLLAGEAAKVVGASGESVLEGEAFLVKITIKCKKDKFEGELEAAGASKGKVEFTECKVLKPGTTEQLQQCKVKEPIEFSFLDQLTGSPVEDEFKPTAANAPVFVEITMEPEAGGKCAIAEMPTKLKVEGTQNCKLPEATSFKVKHEIECTSAGSHLTFADNPAKFESTETVELESKGEWKIEE